MCDGPALSRLDKGGQTRSASRSWAQGRVILRRTRTRCGEPGARRPLAESGIKIGDRIVGLNGVRITRGQAQVAALLDSMTAPCTYEFVVRRARATADGTKDAELIEDEEQPNRGLAAGQPVGRPAKELTPATREPGRQYNKAPRPSGTWVNLVQN